ncbi:MAG: hypothetical protein GF400_00580 [Candidatus Eisenbacteria bacterium]|nr:hypothetical protein [Candidatus Eisenbacteria bacterium]
MRGIVFAVLICTLVAGPVWADDNPADVVVWSQGPETGSPQAFASQQEADTPFFAESVNDFAAPFTVEVNHVHWFGMYWGIPREGLALSFQRVD